MKPIKTMNRSDLKIWDEVNVSSRNQLRSRVTHNAQEQVIDSRDPVLDILWSRILIESRVTPFEKL